MSEKTSPPTFPDGEKRKWTINPTLGLFDHIQAQTGVDLLADDGDTTVVMGLLFNRRQLGAVLWSAVEKNAVGVSREQFVDSLDGDSLTAGWGALVDAIVFFTPKNLRASVQAGFDAQVEALEQGVTAMAEVAASEETGNAITAAVKQMKVGMQSALPKAFAKSAGSLAESSA